MNIEPWQIELEYEITKYFEKTVEPLKNICPKCKNIIIGNICTTCNIPTKVEKYFDPDWEDYAIEVEQENEKFFKNLKWEDAPDKDEIDEKD